MLNGGGMEVQGTDAGMIGPGSPFVFSTRSGQDWLITTTTTPSTTVAPGSRSGR